MRRTARGEALSSGGARQIQQKGKASRQRLCRAKGGGQEVPREVATAKLHGHLWPSFKDLGL